MLQNERVTTPIWKKIIYLIIVIIVFILQIMLYYFAVAGSFQNSSLLYVLGIVLAVLVSLHIINSDAQASYKVTWITLIFILPFFFSLLYFSNSTAKRLPKRKRRKLEKLLNEHKKEVFRSYNDSDSFVNRMAKLIYEDSYYPTYNNTKVLFFKDASIKHKHMIESIKKAKEYVYLEYFILSDGKLLNELMDVLEVLGEKGIEIKILYDDIGSKRALSNKTINRLINIPNLKLAVYEPLGLNISPAFNYRDHRKICIIDGRYSYCGGDNLADEYIHLKERFGFWRDNAVFLDGEATYSFLAMFVEMWYTSTKEEIKIREHLANNINEYTNNYVIPFSDGPNTDTHTAYDVFQSLINTATKSLYISTPYLIIDDEMLNAICLASKSGVDVKVLVPKIPDKKTVFMFTRAHYKKLLKSGVKIYEFTPGFNHAKNIIVDDKYAFCGTINMDYRSLFLHYECGVVIMHDEEIKKMTDDFLKAISESYNYTLDDWNSRNPLAKFFAFLLRIFAPML